MKAEGGKRKAELTATLRRRATAASAPLPALSSPRRRGLTLVELLVVIGIMAVLLGAALPLISPASDSRRLREAARGLNTFLAGAKIRARETGRPFGVAFKKLSQDTGRTEDNGACMEVYYVEQQQPYAGIDDNARVMLGTDAVASGGFNTAQVLVRFVSMGQNADQSSDLLPPDVDPDDIPYGMIRRGDILQIGDHRFRFVDEANGGAELENGYYTPGNGVPENSFFVEPINNSVAALAYQYDRSGNRLSDTPQSEWEQRYWTEPLRYKIHRQPTKTSNEPYQLPNKAAIDLEASGFALHPASGADPSVSGVRFHNPYFSLPINNADDVIVMFSPEGTMSNAYVNLTNLNGSAERFLISSNLYLLVGLRENQPSPETDFRQDFGSDRAKQDEKDKLNWLNGDARWVVVGGQTGALATAENAFVNPTTYATKTPLDNAEWTRRRGLEIHAAREFAGQAISMGGR